MGLSPLIGRTTVAEPVSAPYESFRQGLCRIRGYRLRDEGDRLSLAFEPWFVESETPYAVPCLRMEFRKKDDRIVLERFVVCESGHETSVDLEAAHDSLQG